MLDMGQRNAMRAMVGGASDPGAARLGMLAEAILALNTEARAQAQATEEVSGEIGDVDRRLEALKKEVDTQIEGGGGLKARVHLLERAMWPEPGSVPDRVAKLEKDVQSIRDLDTTNLSLLEGRVSRLEKKVDGVWLEGSTEHVDPGLAMVADRIGPRSLEDVGWLEVEGEDVTFWTEWPGDGRYRVILVPIPEGQDPGPDGPVEGFEGSAQDGRPMARVHPDYLAHLLDAERFALEHGMDPTGLDESVEGSQYPTLDHALYQSVEWAEETFGPGYDPEAKAAHLLKEAQELRDDPTDPEEMADVLMILGHLAAGAGVDLAAEVRKKLEKNRQREWGEPDGDGVVEHVRTEGADTGKDYLPGREPVLDRLDSVERRLRALGMSEGLNIVARERLRQVEEEGFDATHDAQHTEGELLSVAGEIVGYVDPKVSLDVDDPWGIIARTEKKKLGEPHETVRLLTIAGALIVAEIDRVIRGTEHPILFPRGVLPRSSVRAVGAQWAEGEDMVAVHPDYFRHLQEAERFAVAEGHLKPTDWEKGEGSS